MVKLESKLVTRRNKIGILGGSFDPAHKGHLTISKEAIKRFDLQNVVWAITKKNPFKKKRIQVWIIESSIVKKLLDQVNLLK